MCADMYICYVSLVHLQHDCLWLLAATCTPVVCECVCVCVPVVCVLPVNSS